MRWVIYCENEAVWDIAGVSQDLPLPVQGQQIFVDEDTEYNQPFVVDVVRIITKKHPIDVTLAIDHVKIFCRPYRQDDA